MNNSHFDRTPQYIHSRSHALKQEKLCRNTTKVGISWHLMVSLDLCALRCTPKSPTKVIVMATIQVAERKGRDNFSDLGSLIYNTKLKTIELVGIPGAFQGALEGAKTRRTEYRPCLGRLETRAWVPTKKTLTSSYSKSCGCKLTTTQYKATSQKGFT